MNKRAAIYARVSTDIQRDNFSIPSQVEECLRHTEACNYTLIGDSYIDPQTGRDAPKGNGGVPSYVDDYSSRELSRPSLDAALDFLENQGFDVLVVHSLDRLARDPYIRQTLEKEFQARGAKVEYVIGNFDETPEGEVRKDLEATFAKWENAKRVERSLRGKKRKASDGKWPAGPAPYGYTIDEEAPGGLAVDEKQAEVVKWVFNLYVIEGESLKGVARNLGSEGIKTARGKTKWATSSVRRILRNKTYIGKAFFNRRKRNGNGVEFRDRDEWIEIQTTPLISEELFKAAQKRIEENTKRKRRKPTRFYLLSGMLVCERCEYAYSPSADRVGKDGRIKDGLYYRHRKSTGHCMNRQISANILEPMVWDAIVKILLDPETLRKGYEESIEQRRNSQARQRKYLASLHEEISKLKEARQNLNKAYIDPEIPFSKDEYIEQKTGIDEDIKRANQQIIDIESQLDVIPTPAELESLEIFSEKIQNTLDLDNIPPKEKREILELLHVKVLLSPDGGVKVQGWFKPENDGKLGTTSLNCDSPPKPPPGRA